MDSHEEEAPLVVDNLEIRTPKNYTRDVYILSGAFLLIFLAYGAAQNLETTVNTEGNLGTISLGILYLSFTCFSLIASLVVRLLGSKYALILGTTGYWLFVAANLMTSWYTMVPASLYLGFAASIIWVGEGTYLTSAAISHARDQNLHEATVIGTFNGMFWGFFASYQFVGNLISLAVLRDDKGGSTSGTTLLFILFLCSMTLGTILMCFLHKDDGLQQAFVWAEFTKEIVTPALGVSGVGGSMAVYGAFDAICSLAAGRFTSGLSSITFIVSGGVVIQAVVFLWLLLKYSVTSGVLGTLYPLLMAALLGIGDGVLNTQLNALLGILFKHDTEGAFAQLKLWQSASIAVVFFINPYISLQTMLIVMLAGIWISLVGFLVLTILVEKAFYSPSS